MSQMGNTEIIRDPNEASSQEQDNPITKAVEAVTNLFTSQQSQEIITLLRTPTPLKITTSFLVSSSGTIGGGLANPNPETIYECPMSAEAWVHRLTIWCPEHSPSNPLTQGELLCTGSTAGEIIFFLPNEYAMAQPSAVALVAPSQIIVEGRISAPHLNAGERMLLVGDGLPNGIHIRVDIQLVLNTGITQYTPRNAAPGTPNGNLP